MLQPTAPSWKMWLSVFTIFAICVVLWLPSRWDTLGLIEEWSYYKSFGASSSEDVDFGMASRPLLFPTFRLGYSLTPHSFFGLNFIFFAVFLLKGCVTFSIGKLLLRNSAVALALSLLALLYPANEALMSLRVVVYHVAVLFYLLALFFALTFLRKARFWNGVAIICCLFVSLLNVEVALPLILMTPVIFLAQQKNRFLTTLIWYIAPTFVVMFLITLLLTGNLKYQSALIESSSGGNQLLSYVFHTIRAYKRVLLDSWVNNINFSNYSSQHIFWGLFAAIGSGIAIYLQNSGEVLRQKKLLVVIGLSLIGIGFAIFLPTPHRVSSDYVFITSTLGGSILVLVALDFCFRELLKSNFLFSLGAGVFIFIAAVNNLQQHADLYEVSQRQAYILLDIMKYAPIIESGNLLLIFDDTKMVNDNWMFGTPYGNAHFTDAIRFVLQDGDFQAFLCYPDRPDYATPCVLSPDGVAVTSVVIDHNFFAHKDVVAVRIHANDEVTLDETWYSDAERASIVLQIVQAPHHFYTNEQMLKNLN
jgi:hypothetical protein